MNRLQQLWPEVLVLLAASITTVIATWGGNLADLGADSPTYLLMARSFASYLAPDPIADAVASTSRFPPLYPALLAATGSATDLHLAHAVTALSLIAGFAAAYAWMRCVDVSRAIALVLLALFAVTPGSIALALQLRSEGLYLALAMAGLALLPSEEESARARRWWIATLLFAAALLARSVGIALLSALAIAVWRQRPSRGYWMPALMLAPALLWGALRQQNAYGGALGTYLHAPADVIVQQLAINVRALGIGMANNLLLFLDLAGLLWLLVPLALATLAARFIRLRPDAWYVAAYLAILLVWPFPQDTRRLSWVLIPMLLAYAAIACRFIAQRVQQRSVRPLVQGFVPIVLAIAIGPSLHLLLTRALAAEDPALKQLPEWYGLNADDARMTASAHLMIARALTEFAGKVPESDCIYSIEPETIAFYAHRKGVPPIGESASNAAFDRWFASASCPWVVTLAWTTGPPFQTPYYPWDRLGNRVEFVDVRANEKGRIITALGRLKR